MTLSTAQKIKILEAHSIEHRFDGEQLQALDQYTLRGVPGSAWIICPRSGQDLKDWLGY